MNHLDLDDYNTLGITAATVRPANTCDSIYNAAWDIDIAPSATFIIETAGLRLPPDKLAVRYTATAKARPIQIGFPDVARITPRNKKVPRYSAT